MHANPRQSYNEHLFKKIPSGAEAANIIIGEVDYLSYPVIAFVRLKHSQMLGDLTEVWTYSSRFIYYRNVITVDMV